MFDYMDILRRITLGVLTVSAMAVCSCGVRIADADYPAQKIYLPAAVSSGIYLIDKAEESSGSVPGGGAPYRFLIDYDEWTFSIPLSVYRSGADSKGDVHVDIYMDDDAVYDLILSGEIDEDIDILPMDLRECPERVVIQDGSLSAPFGVVMDLDFLLDGPQRGKRLAFGISIGTPDRELNVECSRLAVIIDTSVFDNI